MAQSFIFDDLWGPCNQEVSERDLRSELLWDFCFDPGLDIIEADALHERSCAQILKILIAKADIEIEELEKEMVSLQAQLAWAEYDEWSDMCTSFLREKVKCLDVSLRNLKNKDADSTEFYLLMHTEQVSKLQDLVKALVELFWKTRDKDVIFSHANSDFPTHDAECLHRNQKLGYSERNTAILEEEIEGPSDTPRQKYAFSNTLNELQVKKPNGPRAVEPSSSDVKELSPNNLVLAACNPDAEASTDQEGTDNEGAKDNSVTSVQKEAVQNVVSKSAPKRVRDEEELEQNRKLVLYSPDEDNFLSHLNKKTRPADLDLKTVKTETEDIRKVQPEDIITVKQLSELMENTVPLSSETKLQDVITQRLVLVQSTHKHAANNSTERGQQGKPGRTGQTCTAAANGEIRTRNLSAICKSGFSKLSPVAEYRNISLKEDKPTNHNMLSSHSPDTVRNGVRLGGGSRNDLDNYMNKPLSDFLSKSMHKKPSMSRVTSKCFSDPIWMEGGKMKEAHVRESPLASMKQSAIGLLLPQQEQKDNDSIIQLLEHGKLMKVEPAESIATCDNPAVDLLTGTRTENKKMTAAELTGRILKPSSVPFTEKHAKNMNHIPSLIRKILDGQTSIAALLRKLMVPGRTEDLTEWKVCDLKTIAKELNLTGCSKLKKSLLIQKIMNQLSCQVP